MYCLVTYDVVDDFLERRQALRAAHLEHVRGAQERGELLLGGAVGDPVDRVAIVMAAAELDVARRFAAADPYVTGGLVKRWNAEPWSVVSGTLFHAPADVA